MAKMKRLATEDDKIAEVIFPLSDKEIKERRDKYELLKPKKFATQNNKYLFRPVSFSLNKQQHQVQFNCCLNPFCHHFGKPQEKFQEVKRKPSRYKITGSNEKELYCNDNPVGRGVSQNCTVTPVSNWSIAEEIKRLVQINSVKDVEPDYDFHKSGCTEPLSTPFENPKQFYKRGRSRGKSQRYQCKTCKKFTNVMPKREDTTTYHQQRNSILPMFAKMLVGKVPVRRTCDILDIGIGTYYHKLEWLYRRCLEFLERYETAPLEEMQFDEMWLNTDKMHYNLNNVRKKGQGSKAFEGLEDLQLQTHLVITTEVFSRYVFRSDIAYDWDITLDKLNEDTTQLKEDHLNPFCRKNNRLDWSYYPQEPTENDSQSFDEYLNNLRKITNRGRYVDGLNVSSGYTTTAHYWLIKQLIKADEWRMISDDDSSIRNAFNRVFNKKLSLSDAHHFICKTDKEKSRKQCLEEFEIAKNDLLDWANSRGIDSKYLRKLAYGYLCEELKSHQFHVEGVNEDGERFRKYAKNPMTHPLASKDKGFYTVDCRTDLSALEPNDIAKMILNVNNHSVDSFIQKIRRNISTLERPLTTARGDKKSYIYANFNPKYSQYATTILRTYYNFCVPFKTSDKKSLTPAQRLGLTSKKFDWNDIIYLR